MADPEFEPACPHQWQPIETAPKDAARVLVRYKDGFYEFARWAHDGWWAMPHGTVIRCFPDHWMPLPPLTVEDTPAGGQ